MKFQSWHLTIALGMFMTLKYITETSVFHRSASFKTDCENDDINDIGNNFEDYPDSWETMLDKGYQGTLKFMRAIISQRDPQRGNLTIEYQRRKGCMAHGRMIVDNYFGRYRTI